MNNRGYRPRRRRRITGRFYAFITVVLVLCVMVGVLIANRTSGSSQPPPSYQPPVAATQAPTQVDPAEPVVAPSNPEDPVNSGQAQPEEPIVEAEEPEGERAQGDEQTDTSNLSVTQGLSSDWRNILLLGSDTRKTLDKTSRTDTIIIASVNSQDGRVKLTSIMRDMMVPITNKKGVQEEVKVNSVIRYGGPDAVMKMVNELFGMNITEYVLVNFSGFQKVVDVLGGVRIDVTPEEQEQINISLGEQAKTAGYTQEDFLAQKDSLMLDSYGADQLLTGIQALGYARIRHVGSGDYQRTSRQRTVLEAILKSAKKAGIGQFFQIARDMWGEFETNINIATAVNLAQAVVTKNGSMQTNGRIPGSKTVFKSETRNGTSALWDVDFEVNKQLLYTYIYEN